MTDEPQNFTDSPSDEEEQHDDTEADAERLSYISRVKLRSGTAELLECLQVGSHLFAIGIRTLARRGACRDSVRRVAIEEVDLAHCTNSSQLSG